MTTSFLNPNNLTLADVLARNVEGVAVNDPCRAGDVLGYCWRRKQQEGGSIG